MSIPRSGPSTGVTVMAAVAKNGVIGRGGALPWHLPDDLRRFKALTMGGVLVMGRRTYESIGRPLPGRTTIVVTRQRDWPPDGLPDSVRAVPSLVDALDLAATMDGETFIQGGAQIYGEALPLAGRLLVTWVDAEPAGDTWFPDVDWSAWQETSYEPFAGGAWAEYHRVGREIFPQPL